MRAIDGRVAVVPTGQGWLPSTPAHAEVPVVLLAPSAPVVRAIITTIEWEVGVPFDHRRREAGAWCSKRVCLLQPVSPRALRYALWNREHIARLRAPRPR